jgi:hypothetical protein
MRKTKNKTKRQTKPWERPDHAFTLASLALLVFLAIAGLGAWIAHNSGSAAQNPRALQANVR